MWLRFLSCETEGQNRSQVYRVLSGLTGRAWGMTHKLPTMSVLALGTASAAGAEATMTILVRTVKETVVASGEGFRAILQDGSQEKR